ncbi:MAG: DinB family protein [Flavobacteriaceae bacterium]|nr:DinB family protein [Flavobacteriaceae bacterium]
MEYSIETALEILDRTPRTIQTLLDNLSEEWTANNEGGESWSPYDILGHLIHGEKTDWISRIKIALSDEGNKTFHPFDRFAQFEESKGKSMSDLFTEFSELRQKNIEELKALNITASDFEKPAIHPSLGKVKLKQLMATWVVHDLGHIAQISRVMAKQYSDEVGPWKAYLSVLNDRT